ncbi:hypothetical protein A0H81_11773 [Grifola frondosa]|uniref:Uncharacterized protein n=1 Tax=Grifola frondosa TaxID=5627 RepID=A0A1C7LTL3_GRIFR|nr:hypothetical protein A0H81_11773 [Grifola frondosa]
MATPRGAKRRRDVTPPPGSSPTPGRPALARRDSDSSLPPSSPPAPFSDTDESLDERDAVRDVDDDDVEEDGEDLFGDDLEGDYAANELLDRYSDRDIDDEQEFEEMTVAQRRAADAKMARRDRLERGGRRGARAARRSRMPDFLQSDDMDDEDDIGVVCWPV